MTRPRWRLWCCDAVGRRRKRCSGSIRSRVLFFVHCVLATPVSRHAAVEGMIGGGPAFVVGPPLHRRRRRTQAGFRLKPIAPGRRHEFKPEGGRSGCGWERLCHVTLNKEGVMVNCTMAPAETPFRPAGGMAGEHSRRRRPATSGFSPKCKQEQKLDLNVVLIDNYDSYTYNLCHYLSTMCINPPTVVSNDDRDAWDRLVSREAVDCIVISPGPGTPTRPDDVGISMDALRNHPTLPILGVCLGHQAIGHLYNANVTLAPSGPVHGLLSQVYFDETSSRPASSSAPFSRDLFRGVPQFFDAVRYHSLVVQFPSYDLDIEPIAWCSDSYPSLSATTTAHKENNVVCMALRHKTYPHFGLQFHPESVGTGEAGYRILRNFCHIASKWKATRSLRPYTPPSQLPENRIPAQRSKFNGKHLQDRNDLNARQQSHPPTNNTTYRILVHKVPKRPSSSVAASVPTPEEVFEALFAGMNCSFWLDSSNFPMSESGQAQRNSNNRFSFMGADDGPLSHCIEYFAKTSSSGSLRSLIVHRRGDDRKTLREDAVQSRSYQDILTYLQSKIQPQRTCMDFVELETKPDGTVASRRVQVHDVNVLPFDFRGGYVGFLSYEVRHDTDRRILGKLHANIEGEPSPDAVPTAAFLFADRTLVFDHLMNDWFVIGVADPACNDGDVDNVLTWLISTSEELSALGCQKFSSKACGDDGLSRGVRESDVKFTPSQSKAQYQANIDRCHDEIRRGESYELCLTNHLEAFVTIPSPAQRLQQQDANGVPSNQCRLSHSPYGLYRKLRVMNPAPFGAFLKLNPCMGRGRFPTTPTFICCSSPERFVSVTQAVADKRNSLRRPSFVVESKPIKGTCARVLNEDGNSIDKDADEGAAEALRCSVKNRAENLMIVDLLRNDLSRVCEAGSVHVPRLMRVESFATVHQLVSTVRGVLRSDATAVDVLSVCFPGGSMTGAPKLRSTDILHELERGSKRGPYSGCLGYISLNGCMDMNIVIRTAVVTPASAYSSKNGKATFPSNSADRGRTDGQATWKVSIGAGGAITALSDSEDEYEEMLLKARPVMKAVEKWAGETARVSNLKQ